MGDEKATSPSRPGLASGLSEGRSGLQCSLRVGRGGSCHSPRRKARTAGPSARSAGGISCPHSWGRQLRGNAGPARSSLSGYLKRGESFRHSSKSTVIFILPPPRLASCTRRAGGVAEAAALETHTATATASKRARLALGVAAEGASPADHNSREDRDGSDCASGPSPAPLPPAPSRNRPQGKSPGLTASASQPGTRRPMGGASGSTACGRSGNAPERR